MTQEQINGINVRLDRLAFLKSVEDRNVEIGDIKIKRNRERLVFELIEHIADCGSIERRHILRERLETLLNHMRVQ